MRHRALKRELEKLRGELAEREQQLKHSHADMQQLRRRLSADAHNTSADTRAGPYGRTPTGEGSAHRVPLAAQGLNERHPALVSCSRAQLQARGSGYDSPGELRWAMRRLLGDPGGALFAASTDIHCAGLELLAGDRATAEEGLRHAYDALASSGEKYLLAPLAALLVQVVSAQGRVDEAEQLARAAGELAASDDVELLWPSQRGKALAWQERADEAERRAREAVELIRIRAALSRLTTWHSHNAGRGDGR
jgi:tetratricopeptide (TPR) repeat protein